MDTLTHALSGALLARAVTPSRVEPGTPGINGRMAAGFVAGAFPDIDFAMRAVDTLWYLSAVHQGATHSLVLLPLWAFVVAWAFGRFSGHGWRPWFLPAALGIAIHIVGDLITAYGTMILFPFSDWRPALSLSYVVDPYFTAIIVAGLVAAFYRPGWGRAAGVAGLLGLAAYVGLQGVLQQRAIGLGEAYAEALGLGEAPVQALPQPFSPGHWTVVVSEDGVHHAAWVRVLPGRSLVEALPGRVWSGAWPQATGTSPDGRRIRALGRIRWRSHWPVRRGRGTASGRFAASPGSLRCMGWRPRTRASAPGSWISASRFPSCRRLSCSASVGITRMALGGWSAVAAPCGWIEGRRAREGVSRAAWSRFPRATVPRSPRGSPRNPDPAPCG